jgi:methylmalonyl-CoA mutase
MDLFADFPDTSAAQWMEQITRDLKGKKPEELNWSPDGTLSLTPFVHAEDVPNPIAGLPTFGTWKIGESFIATDPQETNRQILEALNGGAESIQISCATDTPWEVVLAGISLPLIHLGLRFSDNAAEEYDRFLKYAEREAVFIDLHISINTALQTHSNVRVNYPAIDAAHLVDGLATTLYQTLEASEWNPQKLTRCDLSLNIGGHYLVEIARLRACRILWQNLSAALGFKIPAAFGVEAHTAMPQSSDDPYTHLIRSAFMGTAAVLGGADRVYISPASGEAQSESFYRHVARNIPQLLRYESKFTEIPDPVAGAYYLDNVTKELVGKTWDQLNTQLKNSGR